MSLGSPGSNRGEIGRFRLVNAGRQASLISNIVGEY